MKSIISVQFTHWAMQKKRKCFLSQCILHMELCSTKILFSWVGKGAKY